MVAKSPVLELGMHVEKVDFKTLNELKRLEVLTFENKSDIAVIARWASVKSEEVRSVVSRNQWGGYQFFWVPRKQKRQPWHDPISMPWLDSNKNTYDASFECEDEFVSHFIERAGKLREEEV